MHSKMKQIQPLIPQGTNVAADLRDKLVAGAFFASGNLPGALSFTIILGLAGKLFQLFHTKKLKFQKSNR